MKLPRNVRTCPCSRRLLAERIESQNWSLTARPRPRPPALASARRIDGSLHGAPRERLVCSIALVQVPEADQRARPREPESDPQGRCSRLLRTRVSDSSSL